jgi:hypothetical protein
MRWKTVKLFKAPQLKEGETRTRVKFAWIPIDCVDGTTRLFEHVRVFEEVQEVCITDTESRYYAKLRWVIKYAEGVK